MLKMLISSVALSPCFLWAVAGAQKPEPVEFSTPSFESYYIDPEFERLEVCKAAEIDVFFHNQYVTMHSAEYIAEAIELAKKCEDVEYMIQPIQPIYALDEAMGPEEATEIQAEELLLILKAHGVDAKITETQVQSKFDSLSENGRTAILKIALSNGKTT